MPKGDVPIPPKVITGTPHQPKGPQDWFESWLLDTLDAPKEVKDTLDFKLPDGFGPGGEAWNMVVSLYATYQWAKHKDQNGENPYPQPGFNPEMDAPRPVADSPYSEYFVSPTGEYLVPNISLGPNGNVKFPWDGPTSGGPDTPPAEEPSPPVDVFIKLSPQATTQSIDLSSYGIVEGDTIKITLQGDISLSLNDDNMPSLEQDIWQISAVNYNSQMVGGVAYDGWHKNQGNVESAHLELNAGTQLQVNNWDYPGYYFDNRDFDGDYGLRIQTISADGLLLV